MFAPYTGLFAKALSRLTERALPAAARRLIPRLLGETMRSKWVALVVAVIFALLLPKGVTLATPTPPYVLVSHSTKQCTVAILGDDCSWCDPPQGWEVLGVAGRAECPAGYTQVEQIELVCKRYKNRFCCTNGSHHGNCEDLVINHPQDQCGFVADVTGCRLPKGWTKRPTDVPEPRWNCPTDYGWVEDVACLDETAISTPTLTLAPAATQVSTATPGPTSTSVANGKSAPTRADVFLYCLPVVAGALLVSLIGFIARRPKQPRQSSR